MAKDPGIDIGRLCAAMQKDRLSLRYFRQQVVDMVRQFVGAHYSEEAYTKIVPCNLIATYVDIVGRKLIANDPRVMLSTDNREAQPTVNAMEAWCNKEIVKTKLAETLQACVQNALFSIGICKVAIASPSDAANTAWNVKAGEPFACPIDLDDWVQDMHGRETRSAGYMGHRYRMPLRVAKEFFGKKAKELVASEDSFFNLEGDERLNVLARGYYSNQEEFEDMVCLWEIYVPRDGLIVTLVEDGITGIGSDADVHKWYEKALKVQRWLGPDTGPYHFLGFMKVPGNPMPKAPIQDLYDLHVHINKIVRKLMWQAENYKEVLPIRGGQAEDGQRILDASSGQLVRCDGEPPVPVSYNNVSQANFALFGAFKDLFSWLAGNLDSLGGLSPEAKTLGQEQLLSQSASATIGSMQDQTVKFTSSVMEALCWFWYHHPQKVMKSKFQLPGLSDMQINREVHPVGTAGGMGRDMAFEDLNVQVDPYSMPKMTPGQKLQALNQIVTTIIIPMAQQLQTQGTQFDANEWIDQVAKLANMPELKQLLMRQEPPAPEGDIQQGGPGAEEPPGAPKAPETTRNYVRHSQGNASSFGKDMTRMNAMKNGQPTAGAMG